jgi:hypothetical protein
MRATLIVAAVGVAALIPIFIWGIPAGPDLVNHYRFALSFHDSIQAGNWYPGWLFNDAMATNSALSLRPVLPA